MFGYFRQSNVYGSMIYSTNQSNLCFDSLSKEREEIYSRIVNIGASYSKGCLSCDFNPNTRKYLRELMSLDGLIGII